MNNLKKKIRKRTRDRSKLPFFLPQTSGSTNTFHLTSIKYYNLRKRCDSIHKIYPPAPSFKNTSRQASYSFSTMVVISFTSISPNVFRTSSVTRDCAILLRVPVQWAFHNSSKIFRVLHSAVIIKLPVVALTTITFRTFSIYSINPLNSSGVDGLCFFKYLSTIKFKISWEEGTRFASAPLWSQEEGDVVSPISNLGRESANFAEVMLSSPLFQWPIPVSLLRGPGSMTV